MKRRSIVLLTIGVALVVLWLTRIQSQPMIDQTIKTGQLDISSSLVDFGDIDQHGGIVTTMVEVTNSGEKDLLIYRVSTSCGCTTAQMDMSPLPPGETRTLTIAFDPLVHPDQTGPITRVVYLQSSDPDQPEFEIDVIGTVLAPSNL